MTASDGAAQRSGWYHGWNIVAVCVLAQVAVNGMPINAFSLFLHDWSTDLHSPISTLTLSLTGVGLISALLSPLAGILSDKYPARWIMGGGLLAVVLFSFGISFATAAWQIIALFAIMLPSALAFAASVPSNAIVSRWFVRRLGLALGLTAFGLGLAGAVLPPIIAVVMPALGWRMLWRIAGALIALVVIPLVFLVLRDRPDDRDGQHYLTGSDGKARLAHGSGGASTMNWREVMSRKNFWLLLLAYLPMVGIWGGCLQNLAPIANSRGLSQETAGVLVSVFSVTHVCATLILGFLSDRFGNRLPLIGLAMTTTLGGLAMAFGHDVASLGVGVVLVGASGGVWTLLAAAVAREFGASGFGRAFGLATLFVPLISLAPFFVAKTQEMTGSYTLGMTGLAGLVLVGGIGCLFMRERHQGHATDAERAAITEAA